MTFHWRQISGPLVTELLTPDSATCVVRGLNVVGTYQYELTVSNAYGSGVDTTAINVIDGVLGIPQDTAYQITRPVIKKLEINVYNRGSDIFFEIKSPRVQQIECVISDAIGRRIGKIDFQLKTGTNFFSAPVPRVNGVYIIQFVTYFESVTQKIII